MDIISPIINAFIAAYLLYYPVVYIEKWLTKGMDRLMPKRDKEKGAGRVRALSVTLVFLMVIGFIVTVINFIIPPLIENIRILGQSIPKFEAQFNVWMKELGQFFHSVRL